jgi:hypothetical protein
VQPSAKAKGKRKEIVPSTDDEEVSDRSLQYDEVHESDDSGSEFQGSDDDNANDSDVAIVATAQKLTKRARAASPEMDDVEGDMYEAAVEESLRSTRAAVRSGASPSKFQSLSDAEEDAMSELSSDLDDSDDEPIAKGKGKGKGEAVAVTSNLSVKIMTLKDLKKQKREQSKTKADQRRTAREAERKLAKIVGRPLIQVCSVPYQVALYTPAHNEMF